MTPDRLAIAAAVLAASVALAWLTVYWFARRVRRANTPSPRVVELLAESHRNLHHTFDALADAVAFDMQAALMREAVERERRAGGASR